MNEKYLIPASILIAGLLVGGGLYLSGSTSVEVSDTKKGFEVVEPKQEEATPTKVVESEHILGDYEKAEIFIVEYSDTQCPFCKRYNDESFPLLKEKYGNDDKVAFVYRSFPLGQLHPTAATEAVGLECAAELGGNDKFFEMKKMVFALTKTNNKNSTEVVNALPEMAEKIGLNKADFITCQADPKMAAKVKASFEEGIAGGVGGTPTVFVQMRDGTSVNIPASAPIIIESIDKFFAQ